MEEENIDLTFKDYQHSFSFMCEVMVRILWHLNAEVARKVLLKYGAISGKEVPNEG